MKIISLKCQSCGAKLEVNSDLKQYTCNYCGVTNLIDDEEIKINVISSKMQSELQDLKDIIENCDDYVAYNKAKELHIKYPKNKEIAQIVKNYEQEKEKNRIALKKDPKRKMYTEITWVLLIFTIILILTILNSYS